MNKQEFLTAVRARISVLPPKDIQRSLDFYAEIIDDRMEEGMTEEEAVLAAGSVEDAAQKILEDFPGAEETPRHGMPGVMWATAILWAPLLAAAIIVLWSAVVSLYAAAAAVAVGSLACFFGVLAVFDAPAVVVIAVGAGFVCGGLSILLFLLSGCAARGAALLCKRMITLTKRGFCGKEAAK